MFIGRVAIEKNLDAFLSLDIPGTKIVVGDGPQLRELKTKFPETVFVGFLSGEPLAQHLAAADVFVFPSLTDTFGIVLRSYNRYCLNSKEAERLVVPSTIAYRCRRSW